MGNDSVLTLNLDERNLAHFLSGLAIAGVARRVPGDHPDSRCCWWPEAGQFSIETEYPHSENFGKLLFDQCQKVLTEMRWHPGLGGVEQGLITSGEEIGVNPFAPLDGGDERPLLRTFSGKVVPKDVLPGQIAELRPPAPGLDWLSQRAAGTVRAVKKGVSSWGYDCRVNAHASDAGISSDAEGTGGLDPIYPAIELLGLAAAAFFAPVHAWTEQGRLLVAAWSQQLPLELAGAASCRRLKGFPARNLVFCPRGGAHGKGAAFRFFPPAFVEG